MDGSETRVRPEWLRLGNIALVFVGGCAGAAAREALVWCIPPLGLIPIAIVIANLLGAFLLGVLLEALQHRSGRRAARARLLLGTGVMGGFTTYSTLALWATQLVLDGHPWAAIAYGVGTVTLGGLAAWAGIALGAALRRRPGGSRA